MPPATAERRSRYSTLQVLYVVVVLITFCVLYLYPNNTPPKRSVQFRPVHAPCDPNINPVSKRIAIIGAGAGGASTAYHLNRYGSPCQPRNITVYERSDYVGGRSTTVNVYDDPAEPVELGASIFVEVNRILVSAAREFGLITTTGDRPRESPETLGVWDGEIFRFVQNEGGYMWWNIVKLIWKYGLAPIRTQRLTQQVVGNFLKMYDAPHFPFKSLSETSFGLGLAEVTSTTGSVYLAANSITPPFSTDIIQASTRVNYAQNLGEIHGLEAMVCMSTNGAMSVKGGNWQIFDGMIRTTGAHLALNTKVSKILKQENGTYLVESSSSTTASTPSDTTTEHYDTVIIAAPFQYSKIDISPPLPNNPDEIPYVNLHVTLFASPHNLSPLAFNLAAGSAVPEIILTTLPSSADSSDPDNRAPAGFFSVSTLRYVNNRGYHPPRIEYLYKIFSPQPVNTTFLSTLLGIRVPSSSKGEGLAAIEKEDVSWVYEKSWNSYPYLMPRVTFEDSQLDDGLWYTGGIESFISTMETSALMGRNVAKLIVDEWASGVAGEGEPREEI
ncbi:hypothetical protein MMC30_004923 [Trapelia coarctata]|nr:hypothetical protein [Trapelia coarctata]